MRSKLNKVTSLSIVWFAYILAFLLSWAILTYIPISNDLVHMAVADFAATVLIFLFSLFLRNSSMYDAYWSVYPLFIAGYWFLEVPTGNAIRGVLVLLLLGFWAIRLTHNWARGWNGLSHEDWRYGDLAKKTGRWYWLVSFLGIHLMPTVLVFLGCIPMYFIFQDESPLGSIDVLAGVVMFSAGLIQLFADNQLRKFRRKPDKKPHEILQSGLWAYSRHPNYFGEILLWVGLFVFSLHPFTPEKLWLGTGALAMIILFVFISIPMMEKRQMTKPGYEDYQSRVSMLIPWFRKDL
jgi:steroid 5-alpha reductase family enzyme